GPWTSQDDVIKGQTSPDIKGYVADKASVADVTVTADSAKPADEVVTYKKADQKATITFVDQAKKELAKISEGGKS
ncbi:mucin-binding protein, partial [Streptococcus cristatus]|uniref:mucin-binding protein n=2 Tax=Streptococcus TaxID=1301 RepID=UPI0015CF3EAF